MLVSGAIMDATGMYRYTLWREWDVTQGRVLFVMLNPSTADATHNDPTIHRCIRFTQSWGFGSLEVVNLFAYRTAHPKHLRTVADPIGSENNHYLKVAQGRADLVLLAWGNWGTLFNRHQDVCQLFSDPASLYCLGMTQIGQPRHPLYLRQDSRPIMFEPAIKVSPHL